MWRKDWNKNVLPIKWKKINKTFRRSSKIKLILMSFKTKRLIKIKLIKLKNTIALDKEEIQIHE